MNNETSTVAKGNSFRAVVARTLSAAGFYDIQQEIRVNHQKVDISAKRNSLDGVQAYFFECKDYSSTVDKAECADFAICYQPLVGPGHADRAWLISRGELSPDGRATIQSYKPSLDCFTFAELQRRLLQLDGYLDGLVAQYEREGIADYYVRPRLPDGRDLEGHVREWATQNDFKPLVILGSYGQGKSTFAFHLATELARDARLDVSRRIPILVPLGKIVDEQSVEGLITKLFASQNRAYNFHYEIFKDLNEAGRFVIVFDGLDEMKHGMTPETFMRTVADLLTLDIGQARLLFLGRDTAFGDEQEFRAVIEGREVTSTGREVRAIGRRPLNHIHMKDFELEEARTFVRRYFLKRAHEVALERGETFDAAWAAQRETELLSGAFDSMIARPVHAQMLCEIATDPDEALDPTSTFSLYDSFVHHLVAREVRKPGRYGGFGATVRRRFNAGVAWWLWNQGQASTTTLAQVPLELCREAIGNTEHPFDDAGLRRELIAGCLVEKEKGTVYFGHRSRQEFLVAEYLYESNIFDLSDRDRPNPKYVEAILNTEAAAFLLERLSRSGEKERKALEWLRYIFACWSAVGDDRSVLDLMVKIARTAGIRDQEYRSEPWLPLVGFFAADNDLTFEATPSRWSFVRRMCALLAKNDEEAQQILVALWAQMLGNPPEIRAQDALDFIVYCLDPSELEAALVKLQESHNYTHFLDRRRTPALWFLWKALSLQTRDREPEVVVDLARLAQVLRPFLDVRIMPEAPPLRSEAAVPVSQVVKALGTAGAPRKAIDRIRILLSTRKLFDRVSTTVVSSSAAKEQRARLQLMRKARRDAIELPPLGDPKTGA